MTLDLARIEPPLDLVFPLLHGSPGEDGSLQGLLELCRLPYVGAGILGSALGMDKPAAKAMWSALGMQVVPYLVVKTAPWDEDPRRWKEAVADRLGFPCFVKPASSGSSIGVNKVRRVGELQAAAAEAARYDTTLLIETAIEGRELFCGVLGNDELEASTVGEVVPGHEFFDYEAKYIEPVAHKVIPADLPPAIVEEVRSLAIRAVDAIQVRGMARVDFFFESGSDRLYLNELNTIPGLTRTSIFPLLWEASGFSYPEMCDRLIALGLERARRRRSLRTMR